MSSGFILSINCTLYFALLLYSILRKKGKMGILLTSVYAVVALGCVFYHAQGEFHVRTIILWPFLFFFVVYLILLQPFQKRVNLLEKVAIPNEKKMNHFFDGYLIVSVLFILILGDSVLSSLRSGNWLSIYVKMRGEDAVFHHNLYEQIIINLTNYLRIPAVFYAFYVYAKGVKYKRKALLLIIPFVNAFVWAVFMASRTELVVIGSIYLICYLLFLKKLSTSFKKRVVIIFSVMIVVAAAFIMAVSSSRFGENETSWYASYFGESFIVAHNTIGFTDVFSQGSYVARPFYTMLGMRITPYHCPIDDGVAFHTLIAMRYADFGLIGTVLYAVFSAVIFCRMLKKKKIRLGDVYLLLYFFNVLFIGVFYDNANALSWLIVLFFSLILNYLSKKYESTGSNSVLSASISSHKA